jgi:riboflavin kinase / FMN adenylyltransferase
MKVFESLDARESFPNPVLTIGNYDGLHVGHRYIIETVKARARELSGTSMLMTFHPHPGGIIKPERHIHTITPLPLKRRLIAEAGIDVLWILPFTEEFRSIPPEAFVEDILVRSLRIKALVIGHDFKFGKGGRGDVGLLKACSDRYGYTFEVVEAVTVDGARISSHRIRIMIERGEMERVAFFLGRPYLIEGTVVKGKGRGAPLGFPTINLATDFDLIPSRGVYITEVEVKGQSAESVGESKKSGRQAVDGVVQSGNGRLPAVTNIGYNPTFGEEGLSIETHILDWQGDLYDREVALYFRKRLRDEIRFSCVDALSEQIDFDVRRAREYFSGI